MHAEEERADRLVVRAVAHQVRPRLQLRARLRLARGTRVARQGPRRRDHARRSRRVRVLPLGPRRPHEQRESKVRVLPAQVYTLTIERVNI